MRAAPLRNSRIVPPVRRLRIGTHGMDIQNVKIAASSGCPEIQVVALALHVGVQIPAPAERPDILSVLLADVPPFSLCDGPGISFTNERVLHKMFGRGLTPLVFRLQIVRSRDFGAACYRFDCNLFSAQQKKRVILFYNHPIMRQRRRYTLPPFESVFRAHPFVRVRTEPNVHLCNKRKSRIPDQRICPWNSGSHGFCASSSLVQISFIVFSFPC